MPAQYFLADCTRYANGIGTHENRQDFDRAARAGQTGRPVPNGYSGATIDWGDGTYLVSFILDTLTAAYKTRGRRRSHSRAASK